jgi:hypothetical protein
MGTAVAISPNSAAVAVSGRTETSSTSTDFVTTVYDLATGARVWSRTFDGGANGFDAPLAAVVTPDSATLVVGGFADNGAAGLGMVAYHL